MSSDERGAWRDVLDAARAAWPALEVDAAEFERFVRARFSGDLSAATPRAADLYLACAALAGVGIEAFDAVLAREVAAACARVRPPFDADEAAQRVRAHLLVAAAPAPPKLATYMGQGDLRGWLRVAATRLLLNAKTRGPREDSGLSGVLDALAARGDDPELAFFKEHYRAELKRAFEECALALSARDRALLRFALVDRLNVDEIGKLYGVHRATAARWVAAARAELERGTRARLRVEGRELESIVRMLGSQLDVSLSRVLDGEGEPP